MRLFAGLMPLGITAILAASCIAPEVSGRYPLSQADLEQIKRLLRWRFDVDKPITSIGGDRPHHAIAMAGDARHAGESFLEVPLEKHDGQWTLGPKSQWKRITLTSD